MRANTHTVLAPVVLESAVLAPAVLEASAVLESAVLIRQPVLVLCDADGCARQLRGA